MQRHLDSLQRQVRAGQWRQPRPRRARMTGKDNIAITLQQLQVSWDGDKATAKFHQN